LTRDITRKGVGLGTNDVRKTRTALNKKPTPHKAGPGGGGAVSGSVLKGGARAHPPWGGKKKKRWYLS